MASHNKSAVNYTDKVKEGKKKEKNSKKKSPMFVPLNGMSQSDKDRCMNKRVVKPPRNINLIEGDPIEDAPSRRRRQVQTFPDEYLLSSRIKEVNGADYSNDSIEQYYREIHSESVLPEVNEDSTNSSSMTNDSMRSSSCQEDNSTEVESSNTESDSVAISSDTNHGECKTNDCDNCDPHFTNHGEMNNFIRGCRYSKNAAIIGLLKNKMISVDDLETDMENKLRCHSPDEPVDIRHSVINKTVKEPEIQRDKDDSTQKLGSRSDELQNYPHFNLVPHPEDPDVYMHPFQAYGEVDDNGTDFRLPRLGEKTIITPRQFFISEGLNDEKFAFLPRTTQVPKPKLNNVSFPNINCSESAAGNQSNCNTVQDNSCITISDDEAEEFTLQKKDFPTL